MQIKKKIIWVNNHGKIDDCQLLRLFTQITTLRVIVGTYSVVNLITLHGNTYKIIAIICLRSLLIQSIMLQRKKSNTRWNVLGWKWIKTAQPSLKQLWPWCIACGHKRIYFKICWMGYRKREYQPSFTVETKNFNLSWNWSVYFPQGHIPGQRWLGGEYTLINARTAFPLSYVLLVNIK